MNVIDYDLGTDSGTIVISEFVSDRVGEITGTFDFEFETYKDTYWDSPDGYHEREIEYLTIDTVEITSVRYEDELGHRAAYAFEASDVEAEIEKLIESNLDKIERMTKEG